VDGVMRALIKKKSQSKENLFSRLKFAGRKMLSYRFEVTPVLVLLIIAADILVSFRKLQSFRKWDKAIDDNSEDHSSFMAHYNNIYLKYVEYEYCSKDPIIPNFTFETTTHNNPFTTSPLSGPAHTFYDPYDLSCNNAKYITPANIVESTPLMKPLCSTTMDSHKSVFEFTT
jgi:hypothetical protein